MQKNQAFALFFITTIICSCSTPKDRLPEAPASAKMVKDELRNKKFITEKTGIHFLSSDKEIEWLDPKTGNEMEKKVTEESKSIQLDFRNDTTIIVSVKGKTFTGTYSIDEEKKEDEKPGIKLRASYIDEEFKLGDDPATAVTYTYIVEGISDKYLLLQTPRSLNDKSIVILMKKQ